ncbi:uncharacterized protein LOC123008860 [Tribolium madens]|uniref:uncharacterized protein LOC123008860 n=1 Tax=Tribolium madens TaxID=41895 RepID=UPI001CF736A5|nr:uncharacterized protein LOC123008860 [Tribolium madens]
MPPLISLLLVLTILQVNLVSSQDLKTIFRTPNKRNYDEFEILERSNFESDNSDLKNYPEKPKSYANAQILLRIGGGEKDGCACGNNCKCCGGGNCPYCPLCLCLPPCYPYLPHLLAQPIKPVDDIPPPPKELPPPPKLSENELNENVVDEIGENVKNEHPIILDTVKIPDEAIKPIDDLERCLKDVSSKIDPKQVSPNVKFMALDLSKVPKNADNTRDLEESLIPYLGSGQVRPKLLVTHPIFNRPQSDVVPVVSGYKFSEGSWYYSDPVKSVEYQKPPILTVLGPQKLVRYLVVPVTEPAVVPHDEDCCCCSCAKYVGELNEKMA